MKALKSTLIAVMLGFSAMVFAQQDVHFTQYMFNGLALNPAYAGSHDALSTTFLFRKQWVGIDGAPSTQTLSAHAPFISERVGVGLQLVRDQIGVSDETNIYGSYSYWIPVANDTRLSMGLQAGATILNTQFSNLNTVDSQDPDFESNIKGAKPNFGTGVYLYSKRYYVGASVPRILQSTFNSDGTVNYKQQRHYFITGGYVFDAGPHVKLKPNVLVKVVGGAPIEADLNLNALFVDRLWLGVSWRSFDSFDFLAEYLITKQLRIGYAYDLSLTPLRNHNSGSHEIMLNYIFDFRDTKMLTPRYF